MSIHIGICLDDSDFAAAMARALAEACGRLEFSLHYDRELLREKIDEYDLVLTDDEQDVPAGKGVLLSDSAENVCEGLCDAEISAVNSRPLRVYKYEKSSRIADYLIYYIFLTKGKMIENREARSFRVIGFTGLSGRCGVTSAAISSAYRMEERYGVKCLYINLCPVNDSYRYYGSGGDQNLKKLIYYLRSERSGVFPVDGFIETDYAGPDHLRMPVINRFLPEMSDEVCLKLFNALGGTGKYDYLFVDLEPDLLCRSDVLPGYLHNVVVVSREDPGLRPEYTGAVEREITARAGAEKVICVDNFMSGPGADGPADREGSGEPSRVPVRYDRRAFIKGNGLVQIDMNSFYGCDIGLLTDRIREACYEESDREDLY